jgi:hypothetical protein
MERVSEKAEELDRVVQCFYKTKPYSLIHEFDLKGSKPMPPSVDPAKGVHLYRGTAPVIPPRISILAGELMRDMRSILDNMIWQLARADSDTPPKTTAFPVFAKKKLYERDEARFIGGIKDPDIHDVCKSIQPYHAGDAAADHALWVLHRLANDDKHKEPHVISSVASGIEAPRPPGVDTFVSIFPGPFDDGDVVGAVAIIGGTDPETQLQPRITFAVAFGKDTPAHGRHLMGEVHRIGREVDAVIRKFERFFPPPAQR